MALAVATVITMVVASALMGSLRAESTAGQSIEAEFIAQRVACAHYLDWPDDNPPGWTRSERDEETKEDRRRTEWKVVELRQDIRPAVRAMAVFRVSDRPAP